MNSLISIKHISKYYDNKQILDTINLELFSNEIVSIFGPSGSGKTSLLNILGLIDDDYKGDLLINNQNMSIIQSKHLIRRKDIGFIFQFHHLLPEFSIYENLLLPLYFSNVTKTKKNNLINEYLNILDIEKIKHKYPDQISGGERQRVSIIRSIINKPKIVIAD